MKTKKPRLKHNPIEYLLLVSREFDERLQQEILLIGLRTVKEFSSFQYELAVQDTREGSTVTINVLGLRTPKTTIPTTGYATYYKAFEQPDLIKKIVVKKMDKKINTFTIRLVKDKLSLKSSDESPFVNAVSGKENW